MKSKVLEGQLMSLFERMSPRSTTEPPRPITQRLLDDLDDPDTPLPLDLRAVVRLLWAGKIPDVTVTHPGSYTLRDSQKAELARLGKSADATLMLAAGALWSASWVQSGPWKADVGIPAAEFGLAIGSPEWADQTDTIDAVDAATYLESVAKVSETMGSAPADAREWILGGASVPFLIPALAVGLNRRPSRQRWSTCAVIDVVTAVTSVMVQRIKHLQQVPRPDELVSGIDPLIPVPRFTAHPGGHAAIGHALAEVLAHLTGADAHDKVRLHGIAALVAKHREQAGLHCCIDTKSGRKLGTSIGSWMVGACETVNEGPLMPWVALCGDAVKEWR